MAEQRLLDRVRERMRVRHLSYRTEQTYLDWIRRYIRFHQMRHPKDLGAAGVEAFLTHLAVDRNVSASTQNQALNALLFLYREVLEQPFGELQSVTRARCSARIPEYPNAGRSWAWQYIFPATQVSVDPRSGERRRHHLDESAIQRALRNAVRAAGIHKPASCHTLRHWRQIVNAVERGKAAIVAVDEMECRRLRGKDIDFESRLTVRLT